MSDKRLIIRTRAIHWTRAVAVANRFMADFPDRVDSGKGVRDCCIFAGPDDVCLAVYATATAIVVV